MPLLRRAAGTGRAAAAAAAVALALALPAQGALYKWVDANGRTVYSDQPPAGNVKAEIVGAAPAASNPDAVKDLANKEAEFKKRQMDRADDAKKSEKSRAESQRLAQACQQMRTQVAGLRRADVAMFRLNDKGERVLLDDATRKVEAEKLDGMIRERNCPPPPPG